MKGGPAEAADPRGSISTILHLVVQTRLSPWYTTGAADSKRYAYPAGPSVVVGSVGMCLDVRVFVGSGIGDRGLGIGECVEIFSHISISSFQNPDFSPLSKGDNREAFPPI